MFEKIILLNQLYQSITYDKFYPKIEFLMQQYRGRESDSNKTHK